MQQEEEIAAMRRELAGDSENETGGPDLPKGPFREASEQKWNTATLKAQKKEMQEAMAHVCHCTMSEDMPCDMISLFDCLHP